MSGRKSRSKVCKVEGCNKKHKAKGYCSTHYTRYKKLGIAELDQPKLDENLKWKTIEGFSRYEVSENGYVRTKKKSRTRSEGYVLKGSYTSDGYKYYKLVNDNGEKVRVSAHRLVINAFVGPQPSPIHQVAHWDGDKTNNHYTNLRWATPQENTNDKKRHGTVLSGSNNPRARLTENDVKEIRKKYSGKYGDIQKLANEYGLSHSAMWSIVHGVNWRNVN